MTRHRSDVAWSPAALLFLIATAGCVSATDASLPIQHVTFNLSRAGAATTGISGPYVSVIDSVDLTVTTSGGGVQRFGKRLARRDGLASFPVTVTRGQNDFTARVISSVGTVLYDGTRSANITETSFAVDVPLTARAPLLLVAPDTAKVAQQFRGQIGGVFLIKTVTIHNRGSGTFLWSVKDTLPSSSTSQCTGGCIGFFPYADTLTAGDSSAVMIYRKSAVPALPGPDPFSLPITFVITSGANGEVPVVVTPF